MNSELRPAFGERSRRPDIQGLRAVAVLAVVTFHAFPDALPGGYIGVDIFFVISGFLITGLVLRDADEHRFSLADFYRRRIRRIFPALTVLLCACLTAGFWLLGPKDYRELGNTVVATALFASNIVFWRASGYFDGASELKPLLHTWSLAVEEQFYLLYPPLICFIAARARASLKTWLLVLLILSLLLSQAMARLAPTAAFFLTPSRGFELLIGAALAVGLIPQLQTQRARIAASVMGAGLILIPLFTYSADTTFPGLAAAVPCCGAAMVIHAGTSARAFGGRLLAFAPLTSVGNVSYSLYLWHWPALAFLRHYYGSRLDYGQAAIAVIFSAICAYLSYHLVERRFLERRADGLPFLGIGAAAMVPIAATGAAVFLLHGIPSRFQPGAQRMFAAADDFNRSRDKCHNSNGPARHLDQDCIFGSSAHAPDVAVWGDSHGAELAVALGHRAGATGRSLMEITSSACPPALRFVANNHRWCATQNQQNLSELVSNASLHTIILAANAVRYEDQDRLMAGYGDAVHALVTAGKRVILMLQIPTMDNDPPERIGLTVSHGNDPRNIGIDRNSFYSQSAQWRAFLERLAAGYGIETYDPAESLCDRRLCRVYDATAGVLYFDRDHLSVSGATYAARGLADKLYLPDTKLALRPR